MMRTPATQIADPSSREQIWVRLLLYPTHTLPTAAAPVIVAVGLAGREGVLQWWPATLALLCSWLVHVAGVFADNHELLRRHNAVPEHPELLEALRVGTLDLSVLRGATIACLALAAMPGPYLAYRGGPLVIFLGVLGMVISLSYAAGPWRYAPRGLADPIFFAMFGIVAVAGAFYIQAVWNVENVWSRIAVSEALPAAAFFLGIPIGALVTNVLVIDDIRDRHFDEAKSWRTTAVRHGLLGSRVEFLLNLAVAYSAPLAIWAFMDISAWILLPLVSAPLAMPIARAVLTWDTTADLFPMTPRSSILALVYAALLALGLAIG